MINIIIDSGFWMAFYSGGDKFHQTARDTFKIINKHNLIVPWPTMYETLNTTFVNDKAEFSKFKILIKQPNFIRIEDSKYKESAWEKTISQTEINKRLKTPSLVDHIIREMMNDNQLRIKYIVTFNPGDFAEICNKRKIILLNYVPDKIY